MPSESVTLNVEQEHLLTQLAQSHARILSLAQQGELDLSRVRQLADEEAVLPWLLQPMPIDPGEHVLASHSYARPYLERLTQYDSSHVVNADETHSYTPRKILRRILDHALDHLNQLEQWLTWQQYGIVPRPTDGWTTSGETLPEDLQPLSAVELQSWLWRIDLTVNMVVQRAKQLRSEQLDWQPSDDQWTLRYMLHHLALAEVYYAIWMEETLPNEPLARYSEVSNRVVQRLRQLFALPPAEHMVLFNPEAEPATAEQIAHMVLAQEQTLLSR